ncbi:hypothetical protein [Haloarchaeobius sp. DT45]|uniref:hypothetical protein n=1 Tax=Haloarchaeobius sp. DT45 TaxID=3446116 RepID=UPI003F6D4AA8
MVSDDTSRRRLLRAGVAGAGSALLAGCSGLLDSPQFARRLESDTERSVIAGGPTPDAGPQFVATVATSEAQAAARLNLDALAEAGRDPWMDVDYSTAFVTAFVSRLQVTPPGISKGGCPRSRVTDDAVEFRLGFESWPDPVDDELFTVMEKWRRNGTEPPETATVAVTFGPDGPGHGCFD